MFRTSLLATAAMIGGVAIGAFAFRPDLVSAQSVTAEKTAGDTNTYEQLNLFGEVFERIRSSYVEPVKDSSLDEQGRVTLLEEKEDVLVQTFTAIRDGIVEYLNS